MWPLLLKQVTSAFVFFARVGVVIKLLEVAAAGEFHAALVRASEL
jgi:hypothetical protein